MDEQYSELLWTQRDWQAQAHDWIRLQLERLGLDITAEITQPHIRPWSTVMRAPTSQGVLYFKASAPEFLAETAVTAFLAERRPDCLPELLASDTSRGWMLMADGGTRLRDVLQEDREMAHWHKVLRHYSDLQREMAEHVSELLLLGIEDRRLANLPALYEGLLGHVEDLGVALPESLTVEEHQSLCRFTPTFARMCEKLAAFGIPETLQHDDLHDGNILVREGRYHVFDWGDSCLSHPFFTLVVTLRSVENTFQLEQDAPQLQQISDGYLEDWSQFGSRQDLQEALDLALKIGMVCRALTWRRVLSSLTGRFREQYIGHAGAWLQEFHQTLAATS